MATYKVIQDIEAEDKFVGPLTLKQFVFACGGILFGYLNIFALTKGAPFLMIVFLPPMALGFFLAIPWSRDQPTEMWVLAKLRFLFKPKQRIWDQSGHQELVTVTAPKVEKKHLSDEYTPGEVKSRLKALAETIDSRGWAIKHSTMEDSEINNQDMISDRLIDPTSVMPREVPAIDLESIPDVMDPASSPLPANLDSMIKDRGSRQKDELMQKMDRARRGEPLEKIHQENIAINNPRQAPPPPSFPPTSEEKTLNKQLRAKKQAGDLSKSHMRGIQLDQGSSPKDQVPSSAAQDSVLKSQVSNQNTSAMTSGPTPDTIRLASSNDLNIETVARELKRGKSGGGEVVVPLH